MGVRLAMFRLFNAVALLLFLFSQSAFAGDCGGAVIPVNPCKRCRVAGTITTPRDQSCIRGFRMNNSNFIILGFSVAKQASHGRVAANGSSFTYSPAKGFVGADSFSIEIDFLSGDKDVLVNFLDFTMDVTP
jgi:hypothetical protein